MTRNPTPGQKLLPFADALVEDWMTLSDEEVFAEFRADGFDPEVVAAELRAHIEGLVAESGKSRQIGTPPSPPRPPPPLSLPPPPPPPPTPPPPPPPPPPP